MKQVEATLIDTRNGNRVVYRDEYGDDYPNYIIEHRWTEGNYSCHCNRSIFMYGWDNQEPCSIGDDVIQLTSLQVDCVELLEKQPAE